MTRTKFLNSLRKGKARIIQTLYDDGTYTKGFIVVWVTQNHIEYMQNKYKINFHK